MNISISTLNNRLQEVTQDEEEFKTQLKNNQKVNEQKSKAKKALSDAEVSLKGGGQKKHKPENAQMGYITAMSTMMNDNLNAMSANAEHLQMLNTPMDNLSSQLNVLSQESEALGQSSSFDDDGMSSASEGMSSASEGMNKAQELNSQFNTLNTQLETIGVSANQDSMQIKNMATQTNAQAGNASQMLTFLHKSERTKAMH